MAVSASGGVLGSGPPRRPHRPPRAPGGGTPGPRWPREGHLIRATFKILGWRFRREGHLIPIHLKHPPPHILNAPTAN